MRRNTANSLHAVLVAVQPLIVLLPVSEKWKPFVHTIPAAIQAYLAAVQHKSNLDGSKLETK